MKKYIVRTAKAGVFFGEIETYNSEYIEMKNVRKLWAWTGASSIEQLATEGVPKPLECKFTVVVPHMWLSEPIQIIEATDAACKTFNKVREWKM